MEKKNEKAKLTDEQLGKVSGGEINPIGTDVPDGLYCPHCGENLFLLEERDGLYLCVQCDVLFDESGRTY